LQVKRGPDIGNSLTTFDQQIQKSRSDRIAMKVMLHWLEDLDSSYFEEAELSNVRVRGCDLLFWGEGGTKIGKMMLLVENIW